MKTKILLFISFLVFSNIITFAQKTDQEATNSLSVQFSFPSFFQETNFNVHHSNGANVEIGINPWSPLGITYEKQKANGSILSAGLWNMHFNLGLALTTKNDSITILNGQEIKSMQTNFIFEYKKRLNKNPSSLENFIGIGLYPKIGYFNYMPTVSSNFPISAFYTGADIALLLAARYQISEHFALDISLPVNFLSFSYKTITEQNPLLNINQQKTATLNFDFLQFSVRPCFGLVISL